MKPKIDYFKLLNKDDEAEKAKRQRKSTKNLKWFKNIVKRNNDDDDDTSEDEQPNDAKEKALKISQLYNKIIESAQDQ